ncbi:hypothetical protein [Bradyrhizobium altum]|uniref:hypothetical protein n=1 Tax=Bradyrhizobium altum TaxID=1571202 RepID=UPI0024C0BA68|nr:hypothetical protein [Bradyrhizobium altum]
MVGTQSSGRVNITVFANSQLGGDPEMLSQVRAGGIELLAAPSRPCRRWCRCRACPVSVSRSNPTIRSGRRWMAASAASSAMRSPGPASCR